MLEAPAGFGKTTLMAQIFHTLERRGEKAAWVSLEPDDRDPDRFAGYLLAAVHQRYPDIARAALKHFEMGSRHGHATALNALANCVEETGDALNVFLDDFHAIDSPDAAGIVGLLLKHAPNSIRLIIGARRFQWFKVAPYQAKGAVICLDVEDLRFKASETEKFFHAQGISSLGQGDIDRLTDRTEGWPAGLQLSAIGLRRASRQQTPNEYVSSGERELFRFFQHEMDQIQTEDSKRFLMSAAMLDRFSIPLVSYVIESRSVPCLLDQAYKDGLFVTPVDERGEWWRFHHLFQSYLRDQFVRRDPDTANRVLRRASEWHHAQGEIPTAVDYASKAGDNETVHRMIIDCANEFIFAGRIPDLLHMINAIPFSLRLKQPDILRISCWVLFHLGRGRDAAEMLELAQSKADCSGDPCKVAEFTVLEGAVAIVLDDVRRAREIGEAILPAGTADHVRGLHANVRALAALSLGDYRCTLSAGIDAVQFHGLAEFHYGVTYGQCAIAMAYRAQGQLNLALRTLEDAEQQARFACGDRSFGASLARILRGVVSYDIGAVETAKMLISEELPYLEECGYIEFRTLVFTTMARICAYEGDLHDANAMLDRALSFSEGAVGSHTMATVRAERLRVAQIAGTPPAADPSENRELSNDLEAEGSTDDLRTIFVNGLYRAEALAAAGRFQEGLRILKDIAIQAQKDGHVHRCATIWIAIAAGQFAGGKEAESATSVRRAIDIAQPAGLTQIFCEAYPRVEGALKLLRLSSGGDAATTAFTEKIETMVDRRIWKPADGVSAARALDALAPLTEREGSVLLQMSRGLQNKEIADVLGISANTVRFHVSNVLSKLGVKTRSAAIFEFSRAKTEAGEI